MARSTLTATITAAALAVPLGAVAAQADDSDEFTHTIAIDEPDEDGRVRFWMEASGWMGPHIEGQMPEYSISAKKPGESHFHHQVVAPQGEELVCVGGADPSEVTVFTDYPETPLSEEHDGLYILATVCDGSDDGTEVLGVLERRADGSWVSTSGPFEVADYADGRGDGSGPIVDTGVTPADPTPWAALLAGGALLGLGGLVTARGVSGRRG